MALPTNYCIPNSAHLRTSWHDIPSVINTMIRRPIAREFNASRWGHNNGPTKTFRMYCSNMLPKGLREDLNWTPHCTERYEPLCGSMTKLPVCINISTEIFYAFLIAYIIGHRTFWWSWHLTRIFAEFFLNWTDSLITVLAIPVHWHTSRNILTKIASLIVLVTIEYFWNYGNLRGYI